MSNRLRDMLVKTDEIQLYFDKCINIVKDEEQIVIFGAGIGGKKTYEFLNSNTSGKKYVFCDNNLKKQNTIYCGIKIISVDDLIQYYKNSYIIITCADYKSVCEQLSLLGIDTINRVALFDFARIDLSETEFDYINRNIDKFEEVYDLLEEQKSKDVFVGVLNYKITRNYIYLKNISDGFKEQYFDPQIVSFKGNETFVDAGSYIGDTAEWFIKACNGNYNKIICFEPDESNFSILESSVKKNNIKNIELFNLGLFNKSGTLNFDNTDTGGAAASHISDTGTQSIKIESLDNIIKDKKVDFIKMDIEGAEYEALLGAKETIRKNKPILAVCVYHKKEDFFKLPLLMKELYDGYKFYFRHCSLTEFETVCYAVSE